MAVQIVSQENFDSGYNYLTGARLATEPEQTLWSNIGLSSNFLYTANNENYYEHVGDVTHLMNRALRMPNQHRLVGSTRCNIISYNGRAALEITEPTAFNPVRPKNLAVTNNNEWTAWAVVVPRNTGACQLFGPVNNVQGLAVGFATGAQRMRFWTNTGQSIGAFSGNDNNANTIVRAIWSSSNTIGLTARLNNNIVWQDSSNCVILQDRTVTFCRNSFAASTAFRGLILAAGLVNVDVNKTEHLDKLNAIMTYQASLC